MRSCEMIAGGNAADETESEVDESAVVARGTVPSRRESATMEVYITEPSVMETMKEEKMYPRGRSPGD